jgi:hypothetical protein
LTYPTDFSQQLNQLQISTDLPKSYDEAQEVLTLELVRIKDAVNKKEGSLYIPQELGNFQSYFTPGDATSFRFVYRNLFDLTTLNGGNIPANASVSFNHNITGIKFSAGVIAYCTSVTPTFFSVTGQPAVYLDSTKVYFTNPLNVALTAVYVVAEYLKV